MIDNNVCVIFIPRYHIYIACVGRVMGALIMQHVWSYITYGCNNKQGYSLVFSPQKKKSYSLVIHLLLIIGYQA